MKPFERSRPQSNRHPNRAAGEGPPKPYIKRRVVKVGALAPESLLEKKADVDAYLDKLRNALEAAIEVGERVAIR
jgi:hypothetical protein